jgi:hypothetical protein
LFTFFTLQSHPQVSVWKATVIFSLHY